MAVGQGWALPLPRKSLKATAANCPRLRRGADPEAFSQTTPDKGNFSDVVPDRNEWISGDTTKAPRRQDQDVFTRRALALLLC